MTNKKLKKKRREFSRLGHYVIEGIAVLAITFITVTYMDVGGFEPTLIGVAICAIGTIAAWDIHKREKK